MTIEEYYEVCKEISERGEAEIEVVDKSGQRKRMVANEYLKRLKQFAFKDKDAPLVSFKDAFIVKD